MNRSGATRRGVMARALSFAPALLTGCSVQRETPTTGVKQRAPVTLRYAGLLTPIPTNTFAEGTNKVIDLFNAVDTGITVQPEEPKPLAEGILAQVAGGNPPDLVHAHPRDYLPYVDVVRELDTYFKQEKKVVPDILPSVLEYWLWGGKHLGMPNNMSVQSVYFNKALFDKQGLKTPDQYEKAGGWTFDVYLDLARKLTAGAGGEKVWGAPWTTNALDIQLGYLWPMGGEMWDKDVKSTLLDTKESLEAMQFQGDLTAKYGASPNAEETKTFYDQVRAGQQTAGPAMAAIKGQINELLRQGGR